MRGCWRLDLDVLWSYDLGQRGDGGLGVLRGEDAVGEQLGHFRLLQLDQIPDFLQF